MPKLLLFCILFFYKCWMVARCWREKYKVFPPLVIHFISFFRVGFTNVFYTFLIVSAILCCSGAPTCDNSSALIPETCVEKENNMDVQHEFASSESRAFEIKDVSAKMMHKSCELKRTCRLTSSDFILPVYTNGYY